MVESRHAAEVDYEEVELWNAGELLTLECTYYASG